MDDYLCKPLDSSDLEQKLSQWIEAVTVAPIAETTVDRESGPLRRLAELDRMTPGLGQRLSALFIQDSQARLAEMATAIERSDAEALARIAHAIRGSAAGIGVDQMAEISAKIEEFARAGHLGKARRQVKDLRQAFEPVRELLAPATACAA